MDVSEMLPRGVRVLCESKVTTCKQIDLSARKHLLTASKPRRSASKSEVSASKTTSSASKVFVVKF